MSVNNRYFLAANGFSGFRCRFDKLLNSSEIKKLYIIKGGSGVGKSTLMRQVSSHFSDLGYSVDEILCSSDPTSLDGVVIRSSTGLSVLIDGTAPHEYDMKYPGARDHIIDLSRHLDEGGLERRKSDILDIIKKKKKFYDFAYKYLHLAGNSYKILFDTTLPYANIGDIKRMVKKLFGDASVGVSEVKSVIYSAFSRDGLCHLDTGDERFSSVYYFDSGYKTQILFSIMANELSHHGLSITLHLSPFSDDIIDGFSVNDEILFKMSDTAPTYKADCYFEKISSHDTDLLASSAKIYDIALASAEDALKRAFENHLELEKIYGEHMDFEKNTALSENLIKKIERDG